MSMLIIFGAKYLIALSVLGGLYFLYRSDTHTRRQAIILALLALPLSYILAKIGNQLYFDPRPFVVGGFAPLIPHVADNGFPSDHTLLSAAIAAVVLRFNWKAGSLFAIIALVVGISRVAAGIHHPIDIAGSFVIAAIAVTLVAYILERPVGRRS